MPFSRSKPKLSKSRSNDATTFSPTDEIPSLNRPRTSFSDLRSTKSSIARQGTYPEDVGTALILGPSLSQHRLSRVTSTSQLDVKAEHASSTSPLDLNSTGSQRVASGASMESQRSPGLPALLSSAAGKIDVEQAINLLQELKKTASPEELVSLHRALLPTKEATSIPTPQLSSIEEHVSRSSVPCGRSRSVMPPGLATRGGISEDPLRSRQEVAALAAKEKEKEQHGSWFSETISAVHSRTLSITSTGTAPDSSYTQTTGAYQLGTLRVTNGRAASPEPGVVSKLAATFEHKPATVDLEKVSSNNSAASAEVAKPKGPRAVQRISPQITADGSPMSLVQRRQQQWGLRTSRPIPLLSTVVKPASTSESQEPAYDPQSQTKPEFELDEDKADENAQSPSRKRNALVGVTDLTINTDVPRFQQRWNHRASHLSNEYMNDCDISSSPYEQDKDDLSQYVTQLSAIPDIETADAEERAGTDACAQALLKLSGRPTSEAALDDSEREGKTGSDVAELSNGDHEYTESPVDPRSISVRKADSGYCSEASSSPYQQANSFELNKSTRLEITPERPAAEASNPVSPLPPSTTECPAKPSPDGNRESLASMQAALSTPSSPATPAKEACPETKKRLSPLAIFRSRNKTAKRSSKTMESPTTAQESDSAMPMTSTTQDLKATAATQRTPVEPSIRARRKTLQKRVPDGLRQQQKEEQKKRRASIDVSAASASESPALVSPLTDGPPALVTICSTRTIIRHVPPARTPSDADDEGNTTASEASGKTWRRRSKSFQRKQQCAIEEEDEKPSLPITPERRPSKSLAGHGALMTKRPSFSSMDVMQTASCIRNQAVACVGGDHKDFESVARALETVPQDNGEASAPVPKAVQARKNSINSKKSRENLQRSTATKQTSAPAQPRPVVSRSSTSRSVEDLYPEWKSKPAPEEILPDAQEAQISRAFPAYASTMTYDSIPPIPELPADIDFKLSRADEMITKKLRTSPRSSTSIRSNTNAEQTRKQDSVTGPGSRLQFAETLTAEPEPAEMDAEEQIAVEADSRPLLRRFSFDPILPVPRAEDDPVPASPTHTSQHPGWPGWEKQSTAWKRHSAQLSLGGASRADDKIAVNETPASPSIVISHHITPLSSEAAAHRSNSSHKRSSTAEVLPIPIDLDENKENSLSSATYITMKTIGSDRPSKINVSRISTAYSSVTTTTSATLASSRTSIYSNQQNSSTGSLPSSRKRSCSPVSMKSYLPYRPTDAVAAERSRALSLARRSCHVKEAELAQLQIEQPPALPHRKSSEIEHRYAGGLGYAWSREGGFGGSAGMRNHGSCEIAANMGRKSVKMSEEWGLDLSDVPVYLQRMK